MQYLRHITATLLALFLVFGGLGMVHSTQAQSDENQCETPDFEITSDDQVYALIDESFSYYIVTENDTPYELDSSLPSGLTFSSDQITGTPQEDGDYSLDFVAENNCGATTETVTLTVVSSSQELAEATADDEDSDGNDGASDSDDGDGSDQAAAGGSVGLDEIPETGFAADTALTVGFYLLALLFLAGWFVRRFSNAEVVVGGGGSYDEGVSQSSRTNDSSQPRRFGDGMRR